MPHAVARRSLHRLLTDRIELLDTRAGGTYNSATRTVTLPAESVMWEGPALLTTRASSRTEERIGAEIQVDEVGLLVPLEAPASVPGALVRVVSAEDSALIGVELEIVRSGARSGSILRRFVLKRREPFVPVGS